MLALIAALVLAAPSVVAPGAEVRRVKTGFRFTEGPVADASGALYFTDIPAGRIYRLGADERLEVFRERSGGANGLAIDGRGRLLACEGGRRRVVAHGPDGGVAVLADRFDGKRLNSPNDLWLDRRGGVYFTDPRYGERAGLEQGGFHVYYVPPTGGPPRRVAADLAMPNGVAGTPDGATLYVADHGAGRVFAYAVAPDGGLTDKRPFAREKVDGLTVDADGRVYLTTWGGVAVYAPDGQLIERIRVPEPPTNVAFGGPDRRTLYITARTSLYAVRLAAAGPPPVCVPDRAAWQATRPLLEARCGACHGPVPARGAPYSLLDMDALLAGAVGTRGVDRLAARLRDGTMPPAGHPPPTPTERETLVRWATCAPP